MVEDRAERVALRNIPDEYPSGLRHTTDPATERFFFAKGYRLAFSETMKMMNDWLEANAHKYIATIIHNDVSVTGFRTDDMLRDLKEIMLTHMAESK